MSPTQFYRYQRRPSFGSNLASTMIGKLILANAIVFVLQSLPATAFITRWFALAPRQVVEDFYVWQLGTYMFLHGGMMHLLFNMLMLWMFGSTLESAWGPRVFLRYYLVCGIGGAAFSMFFNYNAYIVGASGAIFGLYLAYAMMFPNNMIYVYFLFPIKAKYLVGGIAAFQLVQGLTGPAGIAYFAHLGGMAAGLLFFRNQLFSGKKRTSFGARDKWRLYMNQKRRGHTKQETASIDSILDKISAKGYDNLTTTEKRILENYGRKRDEDAE